MSSTSSNQVPKHIVIIPDGNRRWAKKHGLAPVEGHKKGLDTAFRIVKASKDLGVKVLTLWSFSTENWSRPRTEVHYLMRIYQIFFKKHVKELIAEGVRFKWLGRRDRVPKTLKTLLEKIEQETAKNKNYILNICLDYGGRDEIVRAVRKIMAKKIKPAQLTESLIDQNLDTAGMPEPDLLIRTSGEKRISGMMPWQTAYTEFYFSKLFFPDFSLAELKKAINDFALRQRRYGG